MSPIIINDCFAWYHTGAPIRRPTGVVLCNSLGQEEMAGYAGFLDLAEGLAAAGYPTLRLQYVGTGNSLHPEDLACFTEWQANIDSAADWLRRNAGVEQIVLYGLRFGALLAASVAERRDDVAGLILLAPVLRGKAFIRQLMVQNGHVDGAIEAGFHLSAAAVQQIGRADMGQIALPSRCAVLLKTQTMSPKVLASAEAWRSGGVSVTLDNFVGLEPLLRPSFANHEAPAEISGLVAWIDATLPQVPAGTAVEATDSTPPQARLETDAFVETPVAFGPDSALFGILCHGRNDMSARAVIMGNSSGDPHCNFATVDLARRLATSGIASFRIDFAGVGDSPAAQRSHVFETDRLGDFSAAIDALQRLGYTEFAVQGLCSGAYHAYHAACRDPRISYALLINLPFFRWIEGFPVADLVFDKRRVAHVIRLMVKRRMFWTALWHKLRHGELLIRKRFAWLERKLRDVPGFGGVTGAEAGANQDCRARLLFVASEGDVSAHVVANRYGDTPSRNVRLTVLSEIDHSITRAAMRQLLAQALVEFMDERPQPTRTFRSRITGEALSEPWAA